MFVVVVPHIVCLDVGCPTSLHKPGLYKVIVPFYEKHKDLYQQKIAEMASYGITQCLVNVCMDSFVLWCLHFTTKEL